MSMYVYRNIGGETFRWDASTNILSRQYGNEFIAIDVIETVTELNERIESELKKEQVYEH